MKMIALLATAIIISAGSIVLIDATAPRTAAPQPAPVAQPEYETRKEPMYLTELVPTPIDKMPPAPIITEKERETFVELAKIYYIDGKPQRPLPIMVCRTAENDDNGRGIQWRWMNAKQAEGVTKGAGYCHRAIFKNADEASYYQWIALGASFDGYTNGAEGPAYDKRVDLIITKPGEACDWENETCPPESHP